LRPALSAAVALLGLGGAVAILLAGGGGDKRELEELVGAVDARLTEAAAGVHARVTTLADLPRLAAAVATDAATVGDLTQSELAFRPRAGETIEIGQVLKSGNPTTLLRIPAEGVVAPLAEPGVHLGIDGDRVILTEVVMVQPLERADELRGAVAVTWAVTLQPAASRVDALGRAAQLAVGNAAARIGSQAIAKGAKTIALPLQSAPGRGARLIVAKHGGGALPPLAAAALALAGVIGAALMWRRAPADDLASRTTSVSAPRTPSQIDATATDLARAGTEVAPAVDSGRQIGRYTVLRPLGVGGMAEVFLAQARGEAGFEKLIALKVLQKRWAADPTIVNHFLDEARLASRLNHPNIVQITDLGRAGDEYFIAMEYIEGSDLEQLLRLCRERGVRVPVGVALTIVRKICDGLHAAHSATGPDGKPLDLVHRDVKSANVFVARNGAVKVGDFGIAKATYAGRVAKTEVGQVKGTAAFMAPEHRTGEAVDRRADLYAVGAIAYEVLSGREVNLDLAAIAFKGRDGWPHLEKLGAIYEDLPPELDQIVGKALAFAKEDRYASCDELEAAIEAVASKHGLTASDKMVAQFVESALRSGRAAREGATASRPS
jgi:hypothetical protein